jgi:hypothetical protein
MLAIYSAPDTRLAATAWITAQVPSGATVIIENRNTFVPVPAAGQRASPYRIAVLDVTGADGPAKRRAFAATLAGGDVLVVPNRRWAAVLPRLPAFPDTGRYYRLLAGGGLGYTPAATFVSPPRLGPWPWPDDAAEETFQVFDHPMVQIYRNTGHLAAPVLETRLAGP